MSSFPSFTAKTADAVMHQLAASRAQGLSRHEAEKRLARGGYNEILSREVTWVHIIGRQLTSPFIYLLLFAALVALILGETLDASMIVLFVFLNTTIGFYQEFRSEQTLKLLRRYVVRKARVIRGGNEELIECRELVIGDVLMLAPGDIVPADARLIEETDLTVDESVLTGESVHVKKTVAVLAHEVSEIFKAQNIVFSGTTVVNGKAVAVVVSTGASTMMGEASKLASETVRVSTFSKGIRSFSSFIMKLIIATLVFIVLANVIIKGPDANIPDLLIFAIALAVSVIPEALPVVTTFSLSRGALRLSKQHVVVKRLSSIEDLGSIDILCTDKTGTLTENELSVAAVFSSSDSQPVLEASAAAPFLFETKKQPNNAFDLALWNKLSERDREKLRSYRQLDEMPFDPERRRNSMIVAHDDECELIVRGAPEEVLPLCRSSASHPHGAHEWLKDAGAKGQRVIAVAHKRLSAKKTYDIEAEERDLHFVGLIAFTDPLKKTSREAVKKAERLGVRVKILTGDSREVSGAVARDVGIIDDAAQVITGSELVALSDEKQRTAVREYDVFARVSPQQKFHIIRLLQEEHEVGFLGEGINDAPALKVANVGLVVRGAADVAQESSDIVLLKKSLQVVVDGIQEGRAVFVNTVKYIKATLASNFGNFYAVAIASLLIPFLPMLPLQILLVNLLSDFPMIAIATDSVDHQELRKPKTYDVREIVLVATVLGIVSTVFDFIMFSIFYRISPEVLQTNWFIGSILTELVFLFSVRTRLPFLKAKRPSAVLLWLSLGAFVATVVLPLTPFGVRLFKFSPPSPAHLIIILLIVSVYFAVTESVKLLYYRHAKIA